MRGFVFPKISVVKNLEEDTISMPGRAAANEFTIGCSKRVEDGVIEFLVVSYKVEFIRVDDIKRRAPDSFGVIGKSLNDTTVDEGDLRFFGLKDDA